LDPPTSNGNLLATACAPGRTEESVLVKPAYPSTRVAPLAPERFGLQVTISGNTHDKLRRAQELLGRRVAGDVAGVLDRALDALIVQLEKQKCGATDRPQNQQRPNQNPRHIPNAVRRIVSVRDGGRCTFVAESGHRCECRSSLQYDHIIPVARGGQATASNIRLRCPTHNQLEAERTFGSEFMRHKRETARSESAARQAQQPQLSSAVAEVIPWLRGLGFRTAEANAAASLCENMASEPLEKRVRVALSYFRKSSGAAVAYAVT
jgi:5-methylcytosine-specific restriction endonuclease McrA